MVGPLASGVALDVNSSPHLCVSREIYDLCSPGYRGRCTAPVLIDNKRRRIVNNESSDIIRMLNHFEPLPATASASGG